MSSPHKQWHLHVSIETGFFDGEAPICNRWSTLSFDSEESAYNALTLVQSLVINSVSDPKFIAKIVTPPVKNPNKIRHDRTSMMAPQEIAAAKELKDKVMM